jgi:hypothetical protein
VSIFRFDNGIAASNPAQGTGVYPGLSVLRCFMLAEALQRAGQPSKESCQIHEQFHNFICNSELEQAKGLITKS